MLRCRFGHKKKRRTSEASKPANGFVITVAEIQAHLVERARLRRVLAAKKAELDLLDRKLAAADVLIAWAIDEGRLPPDASGNAARSDTTQSGVAEGKSPSA